MSTVITLWSKPRCVQCDAVARRLTSADVPFDKLDLSLPEHAKDLEHFKGLGYSSAPITEYKGSAIPGYNPGELDIMIENWKRDNYA